MVQIVARLIYECWLLYCWPVCSSKLSQCVSSSQWSEHSCSSKSQWWEHSCSLALLKILAAVDFAPHILHTECPHLRFSWILMPNFISTELPFHCSVTNWLLAILIWNFSSSGKRGRRSQWRAIKSSTCIARPSQQQELVSSKSWLTARASQDNLGCKRLR